MTDYSKWDFIKVMPNGVYNQEAHGSDIEYFSGPLSVEDLKAKRVFQFHRNTLKALLSAAEIEAAGVDGSLRPEQLDLAAFVRLADQLSLQPSPQTSAD